jgi:hypothetical protein
MSVDPKAVEDAGPTESSAPAKPTDANSTLRAAALGWLLTELEGHAYQPPSSPPAVTWTKDAPRGFPLSEERTRGEQRVALVMAIAALAKTSDKELALDQLEVPVDSGVPGKGQRYLDLIRNDIKILGNADASSSESTAQAALADLSDRIYWWDEKIQDRLYALSARTYAGYQAGRGLAEIRWVLPFQKDTTTRTWLVRPERILLLRQQLLSLDAIYDSRYTTPALSNGLQTWANALPSAAATVTKELDLQARIWKELLIGVRQPQSYLELGDGSALGNNYDWKIFRSNMAPLLAIGIAAFLVTAAVLLVIVVLTSIWVQGKGTLLKDTASLVAGLGTVFAGLGITNAIFGRIGGILFGTTRSFVWQQAQLDAIQKRVIIPPTTPLTEQQITYFSSPSSS